MVETKKAKVYIINNNKGGIGKSQTVREFGAMFALEGKKVLLIDADHQANISIGFNLNPDNLHYDLYDVLLGSLPAEEAIVTVDIPFESGGQIDILPSNDAMSAFELDAIKGFEGADKEFFRQKYGSLYHIFRHSLKHLVNTYDVILCDSPPALGVIFANLMLAFDEAEIIIPFKPDKYSFRSLTKVIEVIRDEFLPLNQGLSINGVIVTFFNANANINAKALKLLQEYAMRQNIVVHTPYIRFIQRFEDKLSDLGVPAVLYRENNNLSKLAEDYFDLKEEMGI